MEKVKARKEFLIVGYSFGSLIAIELARLLEVENVFGRLILIDGAPELIKLMIEKYFNYTSKEELQNDILFFFINMFFGSKIKMVSQLYKTYYYSLL